MTTEDVRRSKAEFNAYFSVGNDALRDGPVHKGASGNTCRMASSRGFPCNIQADGFSLPGSDFNISSTDNSNAYSVRLRCNSMLPGIELISQIRNFNVMLSVDDLEVLDCEETEKTENPAAFYQKLRELGVGVGFTETRWAQDRESPSIFPYLLQVNCKFRKGRNAILVPCTTGERSSRPFAEAEEQDLPDTDFEQLPDDEDEAVSRLLDASRIRISLVLNDWVRAYHAKYFVYLVDLLRPNPGSASRSFTVLLREYPESDPSKSAFQNIHAHIQNAPDKLGAPPVAPMHYKAVGVGDRRMPWLLDITGETSELLASAFTSLDQVYAGLTFAVSRERQLEHASFERIRRIQLQAEFSVSPTPLAGNKYRVYMVVHGGADIESHHFPPAGTEVKCVLCPSGSPELVIKCEAAESQEMASDIMAFTFDLRPNSQEYRTLAAFVDYNTPGFFPGDTLCRVNVRLLLDSSDSSYKAQLDSLAWHACNEPTEHVARLQDLFFQYGKTEPQFVGSLLEDVKRRPRCPEDEQALRISAATRCGMDRLNEEQSAVHKACLNGMSDNLMFVYGPPGSGKTETLGHCIASSVILEEKCIATAKTNNAVDNMCDMAEKVISRAVTDITSSTSTFQPTIVIARPHTRGEEKRIRRACLSGATHMSKLTPKQKKSLAYLAYNMAFDDPTGNQVFVNYRLAIEDMQSRPTANGVKAKFQSAANHAEMYVANTCQLLAATTATLGRLLRHGYNGASSVFIDEVAQMTIPELLAGIAYNNMLERLILTGDPLQTGPFPATQIAELNEFARFLSYSIFNHPLVHPLPSQLFQLRKNYRNTQLTIDLLNVLCYGKTEALIKGGDSIPGILTYLDNNKANFHTPALQSWSFVDKPVIFLHVDGDQDKPPPDQNRTTHAVEETFTYSSYPSADQSFGATFFQPHRIKRTNRKTMEAACFIVEDMVIRLAILGKIITVMSFYKADADRIAVQIRTRAAALSYHNPQINMYIAEMTEQEQGPRVFTVDKYQGNENDIVITILASFEKHTLSFEGKKERLNVACSRSRGLSIFLLDYNRLNMAVEEYPRNARALVDLRNFARDNELVANFDPRFRAKV